MISVNWSAPGDGRALLEAGAAVEPDIVILDISMPVLNGIDAARVMKVKFPQVKVVFITMHADPPMCGQRLRPAPRPTC